MNYSKHHRIVSASDIFLAQFTSPIALFQIALVMTLFGRRPTLDFSETLWFTQCVRTAVLIILRNYFENDYVDYLVFTNSFLIYFFF